MTRYYAETPCEHGRISGHTDGQGSEIRDGEVVIIWGVWCRGGTRTKIGMAALTRAFDEAAAEAGVTWSPNLGPILKRARELTNDREPSDV